jgi:predicted nucleic acid-binding protein
VSAIIQDIDALARNTRVFADTNIFDLYYRQKSKSCLTFMERLRTGDVYAYVNTQVLSKLIHKLMLAEAYQKGYIKRANAKQLKDWLTNNRDQGATLVTYQQQIEDLLTQAHVKVLHMNRELVIETKLERVVYGMMTSESLQLGNMNRCKPMLTNIVSTSSEFEHIQGITVWKPMDVR